MFASRPFPRPPVIQNQPKEERTSIWRIVLDIICLIIRKSN